MSGLRYYEKAVTLKLDGRVCNGCGRCAEVCPHRVFELREGRTWMVDRGACIECGACQRNCPVGALSVNAGVGCAAAIIYGWLHNVEPSCGCSETGSESSGCC